MNANVTIALPEPVAVMLTKLYRALYAAEPEPDDLNEYVLDGRAFLEDLAAYSVEHQRGSIGTENLFEDRDFAAVPALLSLREELLR